METFQGAYQPIAISPEQSAAVRALGQREGTTLFMTMLAAFTALLHLHTAQDDIVVGTYIANRSRPETEGLIGFFVNTLVLRIEAPGDLTFRELMRRVKTVALEAYEHQDLPFETLVEHLQPERNLSRNPLFQVTFQVFDAARPSPPSAGPEAAPFEIERGSAIFDIACGIYDTPQGLKGGLEYSTDLFDASTMARMAERLVAILDRAAADPDLRLEQLAIAGSAEQAQLAEFNDTAAEYPADACIHTLFDLQAERTPDAVALEFEGQSMTYADLARRANRLAHHLRGLGVGRDVHVGVCLERSLDLVVALLGVLKAGGAYLPLDPTLPRRRLAFLLADASISVVVSERALAEALPQHDGRVVCLDADAGAIELEPADPPEPEATADDVAYVIYTSGTTGTPKGVLGRHRGAVNRFHWMWETFPFAPGEVCCQKTALSFVDSVWEIFGPLLGGVPTVLLPDDVAKDPFRLIDALARHQVTRIVLVPSLLRALLDTGLPLQYHLPRLKHWVTSGEALSVPLASRFETELPEAVLLNLYGSSEVSADATWFVCRDSSTLPSIPIGRPIANTRVHILDRHQQPVPIGIPGELCIAGDGLARGYLNRPELTHQRFVADPFATTPGQRLYRTGDLARHRPDGTLEFLGRRDQQIKIRGYRIELGEIAATLEQHPAITTAAVTATPQPHTPGDQRLTAYVVQSPDYRGAPQAGEARDWEREQVPRWQTVWDETYQQPASTDDPAFNIVGWNSSYTGRPIPAEEMREWVDRTVERVRAHGPGRVLEIGCGTGLLLLRLAPACVAYCGTDFSPVALGYVADRLAAGGPALSHVTLMERTADDFSGLPAGQFDAVVLNSVAQYFPSVHYLLHVLEGAERLLAPGGLLFVGDVRSLPLLEAFHASVALPRAAPGLATEQLRDRIGRLVADERELVVDPALFTALRQRHPRITEVHVQPKRGRHHNELTRFRYDVALRVDTDAPAAGATVTLDWEREGLDVPSLRRLLHAGEHESLVISRIPNQRVLGDVGIVELIASADAPATAGDVLGAAAELRGHGVDPEALLQAVADEGYDAALYWSGPGHDARFDVAFTRGSAAPPGTPAARTPPPAGAWSRYANNPLQGMFANTLVPELRAHMHEELPQYMHPSSYVLLDALPLLPSGKVDVHSLPEPDESQTRSRKAFVAPATPVEKVLAGLWGDVMGLDHVGVHDGFFADLGGHSLLAAQLISRVHNAFQVEIPLRTLFEAPSVAAFAEALLADESARARLEATASLLLEVAALPDEEVTTLLNRRQPTDEGDAGRLLGPAES